MLTKGDLIFMEGQFPVPTRVRLLIWIIASSYTAILLLFLYLHSRASFKVGDQEGGVVDEASLGIKASSSAMME